MPDALNWKLLATIIFKISCEKMKIFLSMSPPTNPYNRYFLIVCSWNVFIVLVVYLIFSQRSQQWHSRSQQCVESCWWPYGGLPLHSNSSDSLMSLISKQPVSSMHLSIVWNDRHRILFVPLYNPHRHHQMNTDIIFNLISSHDGDTRCHDDAHALRFQIL